jgi:hypothetical protein
MVGTGFTKRRNQMATKKKVGKSAKKGKTLRAGKKIKPLLALGWDVKANAKP